jgi:hypothetical protein
LVGSYAGQHSNGKDCPRISVKDSADQSFCTHASRVFSVVGGNASHSAFEEATGFVGIVEGIVGHHFCFKADDKDWSCIGISVGGLTHNLDQVQNGLVISLCLDKLLRNSGERPCYYRFKDGNIEKQFLPTGEYAKEHEAPETITAAEIADKYIEEWIRKRAG